MFLLSGFGIELKTWEFNLSSFIENNRTLFVRQTGELQNTLQTRLTYIVIVQENTYKRNNKKVQCYRGANKKKTFMVQAALIIFTLYQRNIRL